jgi:hypothetical protein
VKRPTERILACERWNARYVPVSRVKTIQDQLTAQPEPRQPGMVPIRGTDANAAAA